MIAGIGLGSLITSTPVVRFVGDPYEHTVEEVIATDDTREKWGLDDFGIMIVGPTYGRVFDELDEESEVRFVRRAKR